MLRYWVKDYYQILEIDSSATHKEVRRAFKRLALKYHPDKIRYLEDPGQVLFKAVNEAHEILSDPEKRKKYDVRYRGFRLYMSRRCDQSLAEEVKDTFESVFPESKPKPKPKPKLVTHKSDVDVELEIITPMGDHIVSCKEGIFIFKQDGNIKNIVYTSTDKYRKRPRAMAVLPNGNIATVTDASLGSIENAKFEIFDIHTNERKHFHERDFTFFYYATLVALDNERLAILNEYGNKIAVYNINVGTREAEYQIDDYYKGTSSATLLSNGMLAIASRQMHGTVYIYNLTLGMVESKFDRKTASISSADTVLVMAEVAENKLALYDSKERITIYELTSGRLISTTDAMKEKITTTSQLLDICVKYGLSKSHEQDNMIVASLVSFKM